MSLGLTINGIDGFLSGNWTIDPNAKVIDDETLELNATGTWQTSSMAMIKASKSQNCIISLQSSGQIIVDSVDSVGVVTNIINQVINGSLTFTTRSDTDSLAIKFTNGSIPSGTFTFKRPMLNLGSIPAPYEKKRGDQMVLPVAKKNLFDGVLESGYVNASGGNSPSSTTVRSVNHVPVKASKQLVLKNYSRASNGSTIWAFYDNNKTFISQGGITANVDTFNFTTPINCAYVRFSSDGGQLVDQFQLEEGTVATDYEPYAVQINQKSARRTSTDSGVLSAVRTKLSSGLSFNGYADYLQLPSMTMDSIEIECLIDGSQSGWRTFFDTRLTVSKVFEMNNLSASSIGFTYSGFVFNQRTILRLSSTTGSFTSNSLIFKQYSVMTQNAKGALYKITCYLDGNIVAQYDFEKQNTDVSSLLRGNPIWLVKQAVR